MLSLFSQLSMDSRFRGNDGIGYRFPEVHQLLHPSAKFHDF